MVDVLIPKDFKFRGWGNLEKKHQRLDLLLSAHSVPSNSAYNMPSIKSKKLRTQGHFADTCGIVG